MRKIKKELKKTLALLGAPKQANGRVAFLSKNTILPEVGSSNYNELNERRIKLEKSLMESGKTNVKFVKDGKKIFYELGKN